MVTKKAAAPKRKTAQEKASVKKRTPQQEAKSESTPAKRLGELAEQSSTLARLVARNAAASATLLKKLGSHSDATVRKWVTLHPNTPPKVLAKLATQFPEQLLDNPAFDVLLLENPDLLNELPAGTRRSLLKREKCPVSFLAWLAQDDDEGVQLALAMNANTPQHIVDKLASSRFKAVRMAARHHVNLTGGRPPPALGIQRQLRTELNNVQSADTALRRSLLPWVIARGQPKDDLSKNLSDWLFKLLVFVPLLDRQGVPPSLLREWAEDWVVQVRQGVAGHSSTSADVLHFLTGDSAETVRAAVAWNRRTAPEDLQSLAEDGFAEIVAANISAPPAVLARLAVHDSDWVRMEVAANVSSPAEALQTLATDNRKLVRVFVAENPSCPGAVLSSLAASRETEIREAVSSNEQANPETLSQLAHDRSWKIRYRVACHANTMERDLLRLAVDRNRVVANAIVDHPHLPEKAARMLSARPGSVIQSILASRCDLPPDCFLLLAQSRSIPVREALLENPATPASALALLAKSRNRKLAMQVLEHQNCPASVLESAARSKKLLLRRLAAAHQNTSQTCLAALSGDSDQEVRSVVAGNVSTPATVLSKLADSGAARIRKSVAGNPASGSDTLTRLKGDRSAIVRNAARRTLKSLCHEPLALGAAIERTHRAPRDVFTPTDNREAEYCHTESKCKRPFPNSLENLEYCRVDDWRYLATLSPDSLADLGELGGVPKALRDSRRKEIAAAFVQKHGRSNLPSLKRLACLLLPDCPIPVLARAVRSSDWKERLAVACHPNTPPAIREKLAKDGNEFVRCAAWETIAEGAKS